MIVPCYIKSYSLSDNCNPTWWLPNQKRSKHVVDTLCIIANIVVLWLLCLCMLCVLGEEGFRQIWGGGGGTRTGLSKLHQKKTKWATGKNLVIGLPGPRDLCIPGLGSEPTEEMWLEMFDRCRGNKISIVNAPSDWIVGGYLVPFPALHNAFSLLLGSTHSPV